VSADEDRAVKLFVRRRLGLSTIVALAAVNGATQFGYLRPGAEEGPDWRLMMDRLSHLAGTTGTEAAPVGLDVEGPGHDNIAAIFLRGHPSWNMSGFRHFPFSVFVDSLAATEHPLMSSDQIRKRTATRAVVRALDDEYKQFQFDLGGGTVHAFTRFDYPLAENPITRLVVSPAAQLSVVNDSSPRPYNGKYFVTPWNKISNTLVQIDSSIARIILPGELENVALWQLEPDAAHPGHGMQGIGRHILFEVINPAPGSRLLLDFARGPIAQMEPGLPPASVTGERRVAFGFVGDGGGRLLSEPVVPKDIEGRQYLALDLGADPVHIAPHRTGILALYNSRLGLDPRRLVGFVRNISLLAPAEVEAMPLPTSIDSVPAGLFQPGLLFSGIFDDGWIGERAKVRLASAAAAGRLRIEGQMPGAAGWPAGMKVQVLIDDRVADTVSINQGDFSIDVPIEGKGAHWIEMQVDAVARLPGGDDRSVSVLLKRIAILPVGKGGD
jgi:hypothetical protein